MAVVAFSGTRDLDTSPGSEARSLLEREINALPPDTIVIHGDNGNVDWTVDDLGRARGLDVRRFTADWKKYGKKAAGPIRNSAMANERPTRWIFVWNGRSPGSADALRKARRIGAEITEHLILLPGEPDPRAGALGALIR